MKRSRRTFWPRAKRREYARMALRRLVEKLTCEPEDENIAYYYHTWIADDPKGRMVKALPPEARALVIGYRLTRRG